jgi:hypothetical protein
MIHNNNDLQLNSIFFFIATSSSLKKFYGQGTAIAFKIKTQKLVEIFKIEPHLYYYISIKFSVI